MKTKKLKSATRLLNVKCIGNMQTYVINLKAEQSKADKYGLAVSADVPRSFLNTSDERNYMCYERQVLSVLDLIDGAHTNEIVDAGEVDYNWIMFELIPAFNWLLAESNSFYRVRTEDIKGNSIFLKMANIAEEVRAFSHLKRL